MLPFFSFISRLRLSPLFSSLLHVISLLFLFFLSTSLNISPFSFYSRSHTFLKLYHQSYLSRVAHHHYIHMLFLFVCTNPKQASSPIFSLHFLLVFFAPSDPLTFFRFLAR